MQFPGFDPVALDLFGLQIRWYALAYISGFLGIWLYGSHVARRRGFPETAPMLGDLITWIVVGTILGGRLGFILFYEPERFLADPLEILRLWHGGMAFHGGLAGVTIAVLLYARAHRVHPLVFGDLVAIGVPIGLGLGRIANFINGELWGRPTSLPWGIIFPDPRAGPIPRHPSQLYEAVLEGLILFLILAWLTWRSPALRRPGTLSGWFLILYGAARFLVEFVREYTPIGVPFDLWLGVFTTGQLLSLPMILVGVLVLRLARPAPEAWRLAAPKSPA